MPVLKPKIYTIDDIYALPEGKRTELIDGVIYDMSPPSFRHQNILSILHGEIYNYIKQKKQKLRRSSCTFCSILKCR